MFLKFDLFYTKFVLDLEKYLDYFLVFLKFGIKLSGHFKNIGFAF